MTAAAELTVEEALDADLLTQAHAAAQAPTMADRAAAMERARSLRRARVAVAAGALVAEGVEPGRAGLAMWRACEGVPDEALELMAAQLRAARSTEVS